MLSMLVAMDQNRLIGRDNDLPWRLPADLAYFKKITMGHAIVMGRKTFESIGRPLPGRRNIIVTRNPAYQQPGCEVIHSIDEVLQLAEETDELFMIGGAELFRELLPQADRLYITHIEEQFAGDTYFPEFNLADWKLVSKEPGPRDEKNPYEYYFAVYDRV